MKRELSDYDRVLDEAVRVFGDRQKAENWMNSEIPALRYARPVDLVKTSQGVQLVIEELGAIRFGMWA